MKNTERGKNIEMNKNERIINSKIKGKQIKKEKMDK